MRIGVYGGSFNPPHIGHLKTAELAAMRANLDKVFFVPAREPYMKAGIEMATFQQRLEMTQLALCEDSDYDAWFIVSDIERKREGPSIMADTMEDFAKMKWINPNKDKLFLIIGSDSYESLPTWRERRKLLSLCELIVVDRENSPLWSVNVDECFREHVAVFTESSIEVSSTFLRDELKKENPQFLNYIPELTRNYIFNNHLYGT